MVRRPKYLAPVRDGQRWLISYTDVLTLLLILFIAVAAQTVSKPETRVAAAAPPPTPSQARVQALAPVPPETSIDASASASNEALLRTEARLKEHGVDAKREARGLVISLPQAVLFASGDDRVNLSARPIISEIADAVRDLDNKIELSGHADSIPIHNRRFKNNWELSSARGLSLLNKLTHDYGISESRLSVSSHGSFSPKTSNDTAGGRAENRRVEILILNQPEEKTAN
jgi:chemotaxis protein MotB